LGWIWERAAPAVREAEDLTFDKSDPILLSARTRPLETAGLDIA
jgi:hypothetical protein